MFHSLDLPHYKDFLGLRYVGDVLFYVFPSIFKFFCNIQNFVGFLAHKKERYLFDTQGVDCYRSILEKLALIHSSLTQLLMLVHTEN